MIESEPSGYSRLEEAQIHRRHTPRVRSYSEAGHLFDNLAKQYWMDDAGCVGTDPEMWFMGEKEDARPHYYDPVLKQTCNACKVRAECLAYAVPRPELAGWWANTTQEDRRKLRAAGRVA